MLRDPDAVELSLGAQDQAEYAPQLEDTVGLEYEAHCGARVFDNEQRFVRRYKSHIAGRPDRGSEPIVGTAANGKSSVA